MWESSGSVSHLASSGTLASVPTTTNWRQKKFRFLLKHYADSPKRLFQKLQKDSLVHGISRTYRSKDDEGDQFPAEQKRVQFTVKEGLVQTQEALTELFDMVGTLDVANCSARADVLVGDQVIIKGVPVTYLLFLEKELKDIRTQVAKLPTLDPAERWTWSDEANAYATDSHETTKTRKVMKNHIKYEATDKHPAQVETYTEDVVIGTWETVTFSGEIPETEKHEFVARVDKLLDAVKCARERANTAEVEKQEFAKGVFKYLFGG